MTAWQRRQAKDAVAKVLATAATLFGLFWLAWILWTTASKGLPAMKLDLFTKMTPPPGTDGGMLNAFAGSIIMSGIAVLHRHADRNRGGHVPGRVRAAIPAWALLRSDSSTTSCFRAPSIVIGLFVYAS
jgi:phosphate transport system permease protein